MLFSLPNTVMQASKCVFLSKKQFAKVWAPPIAAVPIGGAGGLPNPPLGTCGGAPPGGPGGCIWNINFLHRFVFEVHEAERQKANVKDEIVSIRNIKTAFMF